MTTPLTNDLFHDFLRCPFKAYLRICGAPGKLSNYQHLQDALERDYRSRARDHLIAYYANGTSAERPHSVAEAMQQGHTLILDATVASDRLLIHFDALARSALRVSTSAPAYHPVMFVHREKLTRDDALLLALQAVTLEDVTRRLPESAIILHGGAFKRARFQMPPLTRRANSALAALAELSDCGTPPPFRLNPHCSVCQYKNACYAEAKTKDDLSLLRGLNEKEIVALRNKGIFTLTQYSYTFRPRMFWFSATLSSDVLELAS
jgi:predicted RecB family nuclease